jgi:hypothetical protein
MWVKKKNLKKIQNSHILIQSLKLSKIICKIKEMHINIYLVNWKIIILTHNLMLLNLMQHIIHNRVNKQFRCKNWILILLRYIKKEIIQCFLTNLNLMTYVLTSALNYISKCHRNIQKLLKLLIFWKNIRKQGISKV